MSQIIKPALIIIDMQVGMTWTSSGVRNNPGAEACIKQLLDYWRQSAAPVIHVHHRSRTPGSPFCPNQPGIEVQPLLTPRATERVFVKSVPDAFTHSELEQWLHTQSIRTLVITGVSTSNSVEATVRSAGNLGFNTYVVADGCFTFAKRDYDGVERSAQEVHAMSLANMQDEHASVITSGEALKLLEKQT